MIGHNTWHDGQMVAALRQRGGVSAPRGDAFGAAHRAPLGGRRDVTSGRGWGMHHLEALPALCHALANGATNPAANRATNGATNGAMSLSIRCPPHASPVLINAWSHTAASRYSRTCMSASFSRSNFMCMRPGNHPGRGVGSSAPTTQAPWPCHRYGLPPAPRGWHPPGGHCW